MRALTIGLIALALVSAVSIAVAQDAVTGQPPGFPDWFWLVLGAVLPWLYQVLLSPLPGWARFVLSWGLSAAISVLVGVVFLHYGLSELLRNFAWLVAASQAVYELLVKPAAKAGAAAGRRNRFTLPFLKKLSL